MARKQLYQLYDTNAGAVAGPIMAAQRPAPVVRAFHDLLKDTSTDPGKYPEDFIVRHLGEQDEETGIITAHAEPMVIATGSEWLEAQHRVTTGASANSDEPAVRSAPVSFPDLTQAAADAVRAFQIKPEYKDR